MPEENLRAWAKAGDGDAAVPKLRWTKEQIIEEIKRRLEAHVETSPRKDNQSLYNAARYHFGSWEAAVAAAKQEQGRQGWSKEKVIQAIRYRRAHHLRLDRYTVRREDAVLYAAACFYFGSWPKAIEAAGIPYYRVRRSNCKPSPPGTWTKEKIIEMINAFETVPRSGEAELSYPRLHRAAELHFGSWMRAVQAAARKKAGRS